MSSIKKLKTPATLLSAAAVYPYDTRLVERCARVSKYGDEFSLCRVVGAPPHQRIWLPRAMAPSAEIVRVAEGIDYTYNSEFLPRNDEQTRVITESVYLLQAGANFLLEAPTGSGKTAMSCEIIAQVGKKTLVVITKEDIYDQWVSNLEMILGLKAGEDIGLIKGDVCDVVNKAVVIAFVQSIAKHERYPAETFNDFGFAIWDESASPNTLVTTSIGQVRIQDLVRLQPPCTVWSYDDKDDTWRWRNILAYHEHPPKNPMYRIFHDRGYLDFTSEHLVYTNQGWTKVIDLKPTDGLLLDTQFSFLTENGKEGEVVPLHDAGGFPTHKWEWVVVLSVAQIKDPEFVYDIEVNGSHTFLANGVVVHNCHRIGADHFSQSCFQVPARLRMGLSATPDRSDGREEVLYAHIGPVMVRSVAAPMTPRIIEQRSPWEIPYVNRKNAQGLFKQVQLPHSGGRCTHVLKLIANHYYRNLMIGRFALSAYKKGRRVLIQSEFRDHLEVLMTLIATLGVPSGDMAYYVGGLSSSERDSAKSKKLIFATYKMTAEATDIPWLDTLVMATPRSDVRQIVGRIIREHPGKKDPVVFDIIDATSSVFLGYYRARHKWYEEIGAAVDIIKD